MRHAILFLAPLVAQTDSAGAVAATMQLIVNIVPLLVLLLVLKLLFQSFREIGGRTRQARLQARLAPALAMLALIAQTTTSTTSTNPWSTNMDIWSVITGLVYMVLPFLVLIIVLRSIFRAFTERW